MALKVISAILNSLNLIFNKKTRMAFSRVFDYVHVTGRDLDLDVLKMYSSTRMKFVGQGIQNKIRP